MLEGLQPVGVIAEGGHGRVFLAWDGAHRRPLAVKIVDVPDVAAAERVLARLVAIGGRLARSAFEPVVGHGRLALAPAAFREAFGTPGVEQIYIVMGYVAGPNARELAEAAGAFPTAAVAGLLAQLLSALVELPGGEGHGDLKPENLVIDDAGRVAIVDHPLTPSGTPGYAPPGEEPGPAADVFAAGRIALCLWTGTFPGGPTPIDSLAPPPVPQGAPAPIQLAHERLAALVRTLLDRRREARPGANEAALKALPIARDLAGPAADVQAASALKALRAATPLPASLVKLLGKLAELPAGGAPAPSPARVGKGAGGAAAKSLALPLLAVGLVAAALAAWALRPRHRSVMDDAPPPAEPLAQPAPVARPKPKPTEPCTLGEILQPGPRFLCVDEEPAPDRGAVLIRATRPGPDARLSADSGGDMWHAVPPIPKRSVRLELPPGYYHWHLPADRPGFAVKVHPGKVADELLIEGSADEAPATPAAWNIEDWEKAQKERPESILRLEPAYHGLSKPEAVLRGPANLVGLSWTGKGARLDLSLDDDHPCDGAVEPLKSGVASPGSPLAIDSGAALWVCPHVGAENSAAVHVLGYTPKTK